MTDSSAYQWLMTNTPPEQLQVVATGEATSKNVFLEYLNELLSSTNSTKNKSWSAGDRTEIFKFDSFKCEVFQHPTSNIMQKAVLEFKETIEQEPLSKCAASFERPLATITFKPNDTEDFNRVQEVIKAFQNNEKSLFVLRLDISDLLKDISEEGKQAITNIQETLASRTLNAPDAQDYITHLTTLLFPTVEEIAAPPVASKKPGFQNLAAIPEQGSPSTVLDATSGDAPPRETANGTTHEKLTAPTSQIGITPNIESRASSKQGISTPTATVSTATSANTALHPITDRQTIPDAPNSSPSNISASTSQETHDRLTSDTHQSSTPNPVSENEQLFLEKVKAYSEYVQSSQTKALEFKTELEQLINLRSIQIESLDTTLNTLFLTPAEKIFQQNPNKADSDDAKPIDLSGQSVVDTLLRKIKPNDKITSETEKNASPREIPSPLLTEYLQKSSQFIKEILAPENAAFLSSLRGNQYSDNFFKDLERQQRELVSAIKAVLPSTGKKRARNDDDNNDIPKSHKMLRTTSFNDPQPNFTTSLIQSNSARISQSFRKEPPTIKSSSDNPITPKEESTNLKSEGSITALQKKLKDANSKYSKAIEKRHTQVQALHQQVKEILAELETIDKRYVNTDELETLLDISSLTLSGQISPTQPSQPGTESNKDIFRDFIELTAKQISSPTEQKTTFWSRITDLLKNNPNNQESVKKKESIFLKFKDLLLSSYSENTDFVENIKQLSTEIEQLKKQISTSSSTQHPDFTTSVPGQPFQSPSLRKETDADEADNSQISKGRSIPPTEFSDYKQWAAEQLTRLSNSAPIEAWEQNDYSFLAKSRENLSKNLNKIKELSKDSSPQQTEISSINADIINLNKAIKNDSIKLETYEQYAQRLRSPEHDRSTREILVTPAKTPKDTATISKNQTHIEILPRTKKQPSNKPLTRREQFLKKREKRLTQQSAKIPPPPISPNGLARLWSFSPTSISPDKGP